MNPYIRKIVTITLIALSLFFVSPNAQAYECWLSRDAREYKKDADAVFIGEVKSVSDLGASKEELGSKRYNVLFKLIKSWKGIAQEADDINTDFESLYDYDFQVGEEYLIYAFNIYEGRLSMVGCPRIKIIENAESDIRKLGEPEFIFIDKLLPSLVTEPSMIEEVGNIAVEKSPETNNSLEDITEGGEIIEEIIKDNNIEESTEDIPPMWKPEMSEEMLKILDDN